MFAYNPTVNDMSGQIMAQGQVGAAGTRAQTMTQLGSDIGGALASIGSAYKDYSDMKSSIKSGEKFLDVIGPSIGITTEKLKEFGYNEMKDREKAMFHNNILGNFAVMSQAQNFGLGLNQRKNAPYVDQYLQNQNDIGSGKATWTPGGGGGNTPAPVEPPLPGEEPLNPPPAVTAPGPVASPITDASRQRAMGWWQKRSQGGP